MKDLNHMLIRRKITKNCRRNNEALTESSKAEDNPLCNSFHPPAPA